MRTCIACLLGPCLALVVFTSPALAQDRERRRNEISPVRDIEQPSERRQRRRDEPPGLLFRSIDGSGNNPSEPEMGAAVTPLARLAGAHYADGVDEMAGAERPGARALSNAVADQDQSRVNPHQASDYLWQWGQFLDHDIDLTDGTDPPEPADIPVPAGDPFFDPSGDGGRVIPLNRSLYLEASKPREQLNEITAWVDASNVYGSEVERAEALRTHDGSGRLLTQPGGFLPFNRQGLPNAGGTSDRLFVAGDVRANEQVGLAVMHTLFVREHNRLADRIAERHPGLDGDEIYERARRIVGAQMQVITYEEFLPALLGRDALSPYRGYDPGVDARILNEFSTAAYRFGHSALSPTLLRLDASLDEIPQGHLALRDAFFRPDRILSEGGLEPVLRGLAHQPCQAIDSFVIDDVRNFLFGEPGSGGFDLAALNIQRGRDHGLPSYNRARIAMGLPAARGFADLNRDPEVQARLASVYVGVDDVDLWVGGLAERPQRDSHLGPLFHAIVKRQFEALRDGDRFWYQRSLTPEELRQVEGLRLADVIRRNTEIRDEIPDRVFEVMGPRGNPRGGRSSGDGRPARRR